MLLFVKYALINFRSTYQNTISIDLLSIRISIRIIGIRISKQRKHRVQQAKGISIQLYQKECLVLYENKWTGFRSRGLLNGCSI